MVRNGRQGGKTPPVRQSGGAWSASLVWGVSGPYGCHHPSSLRHVCDDGPAHRLRRIRGSLRAHHYRLPVSSLPAGRPFSHWALFHAMNPVRPGGYLRGSWSKSTWQTSLSILLVALMGGIDPAIALLALLAGIVGGMHRRPPGIGMIMLTRALVAEVFGRCWGKSATHRGPPWFGFPTIPTHGPVESSENRLPAFPPCHPGSRSIPRIRRDDQTWMVILHLPNALHKTSVITSS